MSVRLWLATLALAAAGRTSSAQRVQPELRVDVVGPEPYSVQPGAGAVIPLGYYVRVSADVGYALQENSSMIDNRWRGDVLARVTLDPFRQERWGLSLGGGLTFRRRTYLAAILELEGPQVAGFLTAIQGGVSGGVRGAVVLRRAVPNRR